MPAIVLSTLNAKFIHPAFGLRYLLANLGELRPSACLVEFDISQRPLEIAERLLALQPKILGLGVYIWNVTATTELVGILKRVRPDLTVILGGPEISHETERQPLAALADCVIAGEADLEFARVCHRFLDRDCTVPRRVVAATPDLACVRLPYDEYDTRDLRDRITYVEASRGCPFKCEFCLSSLGVPVRRFRLEPVLQALESLLARGASHLKFVDRTFNLNLRTSRRILEFCADHSTPDRLFHFELIPDRLPETLREVITRFPPGRVQFEIGIQTFNADVASRISRRQDYRRVVENLAFLRSSTAAHLHADLILGLPGETLDSMADGFDRLVALRPHEIQVGILKRLRGAPIARHDAPWDMVYSPHPPYEILRNRNIDFATLQRLRRFARFWDLVANSGRFPATLPWLWAGAASAFREFLAFSDWLYRTLGRQHAIPMPVLAEMLFRYLVEERRLDPVSVAKSMGDDSTHWGERELPPFLRPWLSMRLPRSKDAPPAPLTARQARHCRRRENDDA